MIGLCKIALILSSCLLGHVFSDDPSADGSGQGSDVIHCRDVSKNVQTFANIYINGILNSPQMADFTEANVTAKEIGAIYDAVSVDVAKELMSPAGDLSHKILGDAVANNFDRATPKDIVEIYAVGIGQGMEVLGTMDDNNASELGQNFLDATQKRLEDETDSNSGTKQQVKSISNGLEDFLKKYNALTVDTLPIIAAIYAQGWYTL